MEGRERGASEPPLPDDLYPVSRGNVNKPHVVNPQFDDLYSASRGNVNKSLVVRPQLHQAVTQLPQTVTHEKVNALSESDVTLVDSGKIPVSCVNENKPETEGTLHKIDQLNLKHPELLIESKILSPEHITDVSDDAGVNIDTHTAILPHDTLPVSLTKMSKTLHEQYGLKCDTCKPSSQNVLNEHFNEQLSEVSDTDLQTAVRACNKRDPVKNPLKSTNPEHKNNITFDKSHFGRVMYALNEQRATGKMCDIILQTQNHEYPVHQCVIVANSPYFEALIQSNIASHLANSSNHVYPLNPVRIPLPFHNQVVIDSMIEYMYTGQVSIDIATVKELLTLVDKLGMNDLRQCCGTHLAKDITMQNWADIFCIAKEYKLSSLQKSMNQYVTDNFHVIAHGTDLLRFSFDEMRFILSVCERDESCDLDEYLLQSIIRWVQHVEKERILNYNELLEYVNINNLTEEVVLQAVNMVSGSALADHPVTKDLVDKVKQQSANNGEDMDSEKTEECQDVEYQPTDEGSDWSGSEKALKRRNRRKPRARKTRAKTKPKTSDKRRHSQKGASKLIKKTAIKEEVKEEVAEIIEDEAILHNIIKRDVKPNFANEVQLVKPKRKRGRPPKDMPANGEPIICSKCPREFTTPSQLNHHLKGHGSDIPYLCEICGFSTRHIASYNLHKRKHAGKVLRCTFAECFYTTVRRTRLEDHINTHKGIKNHVCSTCGKAFFARKQLNRHEITLHGGNRYFCEFCQYGTPRRDKLRYHIKKHHTDIAIERGYIKAEEVIEWKKATNRSGPNSRKRKNPRYDIHGYAASKVQKPLLYELPYAEGVSSSTSREVESREEQSGTASSIQVVGEASGTMLTMVPEGDRMKVQIPADSNISEEMIQYLATYTAEQMHSSDGHALWLPR